jgi:type IV pilus assembly protein PilC
MATITYEYAVRDRDGKLVKGTLDAENQGQVVQKLKTLGYAPVSITQANSGMNKEITIPGFGGKVKVKDLAVMSRQFATMISSGLSLLRALTILSEQTESKVLKSALATVRADVETGQSL